MITLRRSSERGRTKLNRLVASRHGDHHLRYGRRRVEERLLMQHTVTQILAEAATVKEATPHRF